MIPELTEVTCGDAAKMRGGGGGGIWGRGSQTDHKRNKKSIKGTKF